MSDRLRRIILSSLVLVTTAPAVAQAQIYMWRDGSGNYVLSDQPKDPSAKTFVVSTTGTIRTTRGVMGNRSTRFDPLI